MQEQLIGYLIGALPVEEMTLVEQTLSADAESRQQLEILRLALAPLETAHLRGEAPPGLALRTCLRLRELRRTCRE
jgi:anti-sigma-K factor RskA